MNPNPDLSRRPAWGRALAAVGFAHLAALGALLVHLTPAVDQNDTPAIAIEMAPPAALPAPVHDTPTPRQIEAPKQTQEKQPKPIKLPFDPPPIVQVADIKPDVVLPPKKEEPQLTEKVSPLPPAPTTTPQAAPDFKPDTKTAALLNNGASAGKATPADLWDARVVARIELMKRYPSSAMRQNQEDEVGVLLTLDRGGRLLDAQLQSNRGFGLLNEAALDAVRRAAPFPKPPSDVPGDPIKVSVIIRFFTQTRRN